MTVRTVRTVQPGGNRGFQANDHEPGTVQVNDDTVQPNDVQNGTVPKNVNNNNVPNDANDPNDHSALFQDDDEDREQFTV